jgi:hypothetical protein
MTATPSPGPVHTPQLLTGLLPWSLDKPACTSSHSDIEHNPGRTHQAFHWPSAPCRIKPSCHALVRRFLSFEPPPSPQQLPHACTLSRRFSPSSPAIFDPPSGFGLKPFFQEPCPAPGRSRCSCLLLHITPGRLEELK